MTVSSVSNIRRPWRRCSACRGVCHWHDEAWVCDGCGSEWYPEHGKRYAPPTDDHAVDALRQIAAFEVDPDDGWDYSVGMMRAIAADALDHLGGSRS